MYDAEQADGINQVDVKIDPHQAGFFQNTRCSILPPCSIFLMDGDRFRAGFNFGLVSNCIFNHDYFQQLLFNIDAVQNRQKGNGRQCDNPGIYWRR